jgi:protein-disulfide isomerase
MSTSNPRLLSPRGCRSIATRLAAALYVVAACASGSLQAQAPRIVPAQVAAALAARPQTATAGNPDGDVTIVEFLDYNCPFCKKTAPELQQLLVSDRRVRILYKEWPIFGDVSEYAARSALAAQWQGKFLAAHDALISAPDLDESAQVDSVLKRAGVDLGRLADDRTRHAADIDEALARNAREARALGLSGTPGFVVGRQLVPSALTLPQLIQLTTNARASQKDRSGGP